MRKAPIALGLVAILIHTPVIAELSAITKKKLPWERTSRQTEEVIRHLSACAIVKMSSLAKKEIIKRQHEVLMADIKQEREGVPPLMRYRIENNDCNTDITEPLVRSCADFPVHVPELRNAECRVNHDLLFDEEFRKLNAPFRAKQERAQQEAEAIQRKREEQRKSEQKEREAWLFK